MTWPPLSPDLNPDEMFWDEMDPQVKTKRASAPRGTPAGLLGTISDDHLSKPMERRSSVNKAGAKAKENLKYKTKNFWFNI